MLRTVQKRDDASISRPIPLSSYRYELLCARLDIMPSFQWTHIGSGSYGSVYLLDANKVVKFTKDPGEVVAAHKQFRLKLKHLPKIYDIFKIKRRHVIVMERLSTPSQNDRIDVMNFLCDVAPTIKPVLKSQCRSIKKDFASLCLSAAYNDIHPGNILRRGKTIVIIDITTLSACPDYIKVDDLGEL
jgi:serine/threonine protein kinase